MIRKSVAVLALCMLGVAACAHSAPSPVPLDAAEVVHVAPPTGEREADRASILVALERARPGGTVLFAPGMYRVGEIIRVDMPRVTLLGHPEGTTLRGCDPDAFSEFPAAVFACNGFELTGGHQTVRDLTFEYAWHGLHVGCCNVASMEELQALQGGKRREPSLTGGYRIEGNTFRNSPNGIRVVGEGDEPTVIRGNHFVNTYHAVVVNGRTAHVLDNDVSVPEPERVPFSGHPGDAIAVTSFQMSDDQTACAGNVIAGNRVEGHPDAILIFTQPGTACRRNVVRDNTIVVWRVRFSSAWPAIQIASDADSTIVGVPVSLYNLTKTVFGPPDPNAPAGVLEDNLVEGNRVIGAEGVGIELFSASRNRIVNNSITGVVVRDPFPGNRLGFGTEWQEANGAGIWISAGSEENEILGNTFENIASDAVVVGGDRNLVETRNASDAVRDLGSGNRVTGSGHVRRQR